MGSVACSVLVRTYNSGPLIDRCLDAVRAGGAEEILVLDGGSDDGTPERAEALGATVHRMPGTGVNHRINVGVRLAQHELVLLLDDDAFVDPDTPARLVEVMAQHPTIGVVGASLRNDDGSGARSSRPYKTLRGVTLDAMGLSRLAQAGRADERQLDPRSKVWKVAWVPLCTAMVRRQAFEDVGGIDETFAFYGADDDFAHCLAERGWEIAVRADAGAVHIGSASTAAKNPAKWFPVHQQDQFLYLQKHYPHSWRTYQAVWLLRAILHEGMWRARARRSVDAGERAEAEEWAQAFRLARLPRR